MMHLSQSSERTINVVMTAHRTTLQPALTSHATMILPKRGFTWGHSRRWANAKGTEYKKIQDKLNRSNLYYPYLGQKLFTRRFLAAQGLRASSQWKKYATSNLNEKKERDTASPDKQEPIHPEDWFSAWQLRKIQNFEAFKKKIDADPYSAIFGHSEKLLRWASSLTAETAARLEEDFNTRKKETDSLSGNEKPKSKKDSNDRPIPPVSSQKEKASSPLHSESKEIKESIEEEYDIDPITLRKIEKKKTQASSSNKTPAKSPSQEFDIRVRIFQPSASKSSMPTKGDGRTQVDDWLGREGFRVSTNGSKHPAAGEYGASEKANAPKSKIQTSLDRHTEDADIRSNKPRITSSFKKADEGGDNSKKGGMKVEDCNESDYVGTVENPVVSRKAPQDHTERHGQLLKEEPKHNISDAKDAESLSKTEGTTSAASNSVSEALEAINKRYMGESPSADAVSAKTASELALPKSEAAQAENLSTLGNSNTRRIQSLLVPLKTQINLMTAEYDGLRRKWLEATHRLREKQAKKVQEQAKLLNKEVEAQKLAMKAAEEHRRGDVSGKGVETKETAKSPIINAEHYHGEGDISSNIGEFASRDRYYKRKAPHAQCEMEAKTQRLAKEKALVREVRGIYEDTYGTIDTTHRQHELRGGEGDLFPGVVDLAYASRWYKRPAPVSPPFTMLKDDPVSSTVSATPPPPPASELTALRAQLAAQASEMSHLRAQLADLRSERSSPDFSPSPNVSKPETVKRTEPVFSGPRRGRGGWERRRAARHRRKATLRHVLWTGGVTAGVCSRHRCSPAPISVSGRSPAWRFGCSISRSALPRPGPCSSARASTSSRR